MFENITTLFENITCTHCGSDKVYHCPRKRINNLNRWRCGSCRRDFYPLSSKASTELRQPLSSSVREAIVDALQAGKTIREVAYQLEVSTNTVNRLRKIAGLRGIRLESTNNGIELLSYIRKRGFSPEKASSNLYEIFNQLQIRSPTV